jgi:hypothetical protein
MDGLITVNGTLLKIKRRNENKQVIIIDINGESKEFLDIDITGTISYCTS